MERFSWSKWTKMFLFLILVLQFKAIMGNDFHKTVRVHDDVTLPCENRIIDQNECSKTTWLYNERERSQVVELISLGQLSEEAKSKSDRLSVTEDCSLVIKNTTVKDFGRYNCRQFESGQQQGQTTTSYLSVINIHDEKLDDEMKLTCCVLTYERCMHKVELLFDGIKDDSIEQEQNQCMATVKFSTLNIDQKSVNAESFKCRVTDPNGEKHLLFIFTQEKTDFPHQWWFIIVAVGLAALLIIGVFIGQRKIREKRNKIKIDDNTELNLNPAVTQSAQKNSQDLADPEDGVSYASISCTKRTNSNVQVKGQDVANDEGDAVTYSTVKVEVSIDPSSLYATVNKPKHHNSVV